MSTFASFIENTPNPILSAISGSASSGNIWIRSYYGNWGGVNLPSIPQNIAYTSGFRVSIPLPRNSDMPEFIVVDGSLSQNSGYSVIAVIYTKDSSGNVLGYPLNIDFNTPEKVSILQSIGGFPSNVSNWINGHRFINSVDSNIYSYESIYPLEDNGSSVVDASPSGKFVQQLTNTVFNSDVTTLGGSDVKSITPSFTIPYSYDENGLESYPILLALRNGFDNSGSNIIAGTPTGLRVFLNGSPSTNLFQGLVTIKLIAYVNYGTGSIDTNQNSPVVTLDVERNDNLQLPSDLLPNNAAIYEIRLKYNGVSLPNIPENSSISYEMFIFNQSGSPAPWTDFSGNYASDIGGQRRLLPLSTLSGDVRSGSVAVEKLMSGLLPDTIITGFLSNTSSQRVVIDGNGYPRVVSNTYVLTNYETILAECSTVQGTSTHKFLGTITTTSDNIQVSLDYPINANLNGIVREDYPDSSIRGLECEFMPSQVRIYLDNGINYYLADSFAPTISQSSEVRTISSLGSISSQVTNNIGFFDFESSSSISAVNGTLPDDTYDVYAAYYYGGDRLSEIDHKLNVLAFNNISRGNTETVRQVLMSSNLLLSEDESLYQFLDPNGFDRDVFLLETPTVNLHHIIQVIGASTNDIRIYRNPSSPVLLTTLRDLSGSNYIADCLYIESSDTWNVNVYKKG